MTGAVTGCDRRMTTFDIVIPTYKPDKAFPDVVERLEGQRAKPGRIIIINTEEEYLKDIPGGVGGLLKYGNIEIHNIEKKDFDHGRTRNEAASYSDAPFLIFMTMDAMPDDDILTEELLKPMEDEKVAVSYARQLPKEGCSEIERCNRAFNYPDTDQLKGRDDIARLGIKTFFCSNVCACYRREIFDRLGGFVNETLFNEDMIYASKAVRAGYEIYYASRARVCHSHDLSAKEQYHRNFDLGVSQAEHPEVFEGISSESEGMKLVKRSIGHLCRVGKPYLIPDFVIKCAARYLGYKKGRNFAGLSKKEILKMTTDPGYFLRKWEKDKG